MQGLDSAPRKYLVSLRRAMYSHEIQDNKEKILLFRRRWPVDSLSRRTARVRRGNLQHSLVSGRTRRSMLSWLLCTRGSEGSITNHHHQIPIMTRKQQIVTTFSLLSTRATSFHHTRSTDVYNMTHTCRQASRVSIPNRSLQTTTITLTCPCH